MTLEEENQKLRELLEMFADEKNWLKTYDGEAVWDPKPAFLYPDEPEKFVRFELQKILGR